jgi:ribonuclease Z
MRATFRPHLVNDFFGDPALYVRIADQKQALLFDCGDLHALSQKELLKIHSVFISHGHIDHLIGFDRLLRAFLYLDRQLFVYGPAGMIDLIKQRLAGYTWNLIENHPFIVTVREWTDSEIRECSFRASERFTPGPLQCQQSGDRCLVETPNWTVRVKALTHGDIDSLAFSLEETLRITIQKDALTARQYRPGPWLTHFTNMIKDSAPDDRKVEVPLENGDDKLVSLGTLKRIIAHCEKGMKLTYVADSSPTAENSQKIVDLAKDADMLVIEAAFAHTDLEWAKQCHHLTAQLSGELARKAGVTKLLVYHHSPRYHNTPTLLWTEAMDAFDGI